MEKANDILAKMDVLLDKLVKNAEELKTISYHVISEEELAPLQLSQEQLIADLVKLDLELDAMTHHKKLEEASPVRSRIRDKLTKFQSLNQNFIDNLAKTRGLIHFELGQIKAQQKK